MLKSSKNKKPKIGLQYVYSFLFFASKTNIKLPRKTASPEFRYLLSLYEDVYYDSNNNRHFRFYIIEKGKILRQIKRITWKTFSCKPEAMDMISLKQLWNVQVAVMNYSSRPKVIIACELLSARSTYFSFSIPTAVALSTPSSLFLSVPITIFLVKVGRRAAYPITIFLLQRCSWHRFSVRRDRRQSVRRERDRNICCRYR